MHSALTIYFNPPQEIVGSTKVLGKRVADELDLRPGTSTSFTPPPRSTLTRSLRFPAYSASQDGQEEGSRRCARRRVRLPTRLQIVCVG